MGRRYSLDWQHCKQRPRSIPRLAHEPLATLSALCWSFSNVRNLCQRRHLNLSPRTRSLISRLRLSFAASAPRCHLTLPRMLKSSLSPRSTMRPSKRLCLYHVTNLRSFFQLRSMRPREYSQRLPSSSLRMATALPHWTKQKRYAPGTELTTSGSLLARRL